jgi:hypothetical protein
MFKLNQAKYDLGAYAAFPFKCFSNSVENSRAFLFFVFDVVLASLVTLIRVAKLAIVSVPTFVAFSIWAYIGYNSYILDVLS